MRGVPFGNTCFEINVQIYEKKAEYENTFCFIKIFVFFF